SHQRWRHQQKGWMDVRLVRLHAYGGPGVLQVEEAPVPEPGPGQVLVRPQAIAGNFAHTQIRAGAGGLFPRPGPYGPTRQVGGEATAVGPGVTSLAGGDRISALAGENAYADFVAVDAAWAALVPRDMDAAAATVLAMLGPTALGVVHMGRVGPGDTVLVQSAA